MLSIVPMQAIPNHTFSAVIPFDEENINLRFTMQYNEIAGFWFVDISKDDTMLLSGYPLIPAQDLLEQFGLTVVGLPTSRMSFSLIITTVKLRLTLIRTPHTLNSLRQITTTKFSIMTLRTLR